jgi:hypothetical protein
MRATLREQDHVMNDEAIRTLPATLTRTARSIENTSEDSGWCVATRNAATNTAMSGAPATIDQCSATRLRTDPHRFLARGRFLVGLLAL